MLADYKGKRTEIESMVKDIVKSITNANKIALEAMDSCDELKFTEARESLKGLSQKAVTIDNEIVKVFALYSPEARDLRLLIAYLKATNEILRASTNTKNFIKGCTLICEKLGDKTINEYIKPLHKESVATLETLLDMLEARGDSEEIQECFRKIVVYENKTDDLSQVIEADLVTQLQDKNDYETIHKVISSIRKSEKIADRVLNIASLLLYAEIGGELYQEVN